MKLSSTTDYESMPEAWRLAYERDRRGKADYADPAPERRAAKALAAFIMAGLVFLALPGTFLGVWNLIVISEHRAATAASNAWIQAHGHAQLFGWVGSFIFGISLYVLPKFRGRPLKSFGLVWTIWALWTAGVAWRWWTGIGAHEWRVGLVGSAVLELIAYALVQRILVFRSGGAKKKPSDLGSWLGIFGYGSLGVALILNLSVGVFLALRRTSPAFPPLWDRTFLIIALWGFAVTVAWGFSTRFVTIFLGLKSPLHSAAKWLSIGVAAIVILALMRQFFLADLLALALTLAAVWAIRIFHAQARPPKLVGVYRRYPAFIRLAYGWLLVGAVLGVAADIFPRVIGLDGASRHAITVGFIATLIFALAPRILPSFLNGRELYSLHLEALSLWLLSVGCVLRVLSEAVAYSAGGPLWSLLPLSAFLELAAVIAFVINMAATLTQPLPAWFSASGVSPALPLYWYVTSFPKTRPILIESGLRTLAGKRNVPRSLSLADAVAADGADLNALLAKLNEFFAERQPRRTGRS
ncbi:MAG: NnrS family protein [Acidobacteriota bacterium]|nr:NnrS family protein [Acidobacteriota bacterium]